jgi:tRNA uridine 5-carbamoylmethylation protein Kti12
VCKYEQPDPSNRWTIEQFTIDFQQNTLKMLQVSVIREEK